MKGVGYHSGTSLIKVPVNCTVPYKIFIFYIFYNQECNISMTGIVYWLHWHWHTLSVKLSFYSSILSAVIFDMLHVSSCLFAIAYYLHWHMSLLEYTAYTTLTWNNPCQFLIYCSVLPVLTWHTPHLSFCKVETQSIFSQSVRLKVKEIYFYLVSFSVMSVWNCSVLASHEESFISFCHCWQNA